MKRKAIIADVFRTDNKDYQHLNEDDILFLVGAHIFKMPMHNQRNTAQFTMNMFLQYFDITARGTIENIKQSIVKLTDMGIINSNVEDLSINVNDIITIQFPMIRNTFTEVDLSLVDKIWFDNSSNISQKKAMLYIYVILSSYQGTNDFSYVSIRTMRQITKFGFNRIQRAISQLSDIDVIKYSSVPMTTNNDGNFVRPNNVYTIENGIDPLDRLSKGIEASSNAAIQHGNIVSISEHPEYHGSEEPIF